MQAAVNRNRIKHANEVVNQYMHWFDDEVFELYPTWEACERSAIFSRPLLEKYFGPIDNENRIGIASYAKCVQSGIGREVLAKMLEGTETRSAIEEALRILPMTDRLAAARPFPPVPMGVHQRQKLYKNCTL